MTGRKQAGEACDFKDRGGLELFNNGKKAGFTLDRSPLHHRPKEPDRTQACMRKCMKTPCRQPDQDSMPGPSYHKSTVLTTGPLCSLF
ncbi:hypothetical protein ATANTOWER_005373 [Ataeniobius toweri]|uniref:Uncharacterized protein n=1 Tax=Ataeniobius toweri TaxID=208326 RepID=A0ABU7BMA1_9TELE|nr:hypothetical protein [Ataeniobius toweri]